MQQERRRWSIVSKSPRGMYLLDADLKAEMVSFPILIFFPFFSCASSNSASLSHLCHISLILQRREGIVPDTWVWPARMSTYLHMVPDEEVDFSKRGPGAYQALASGKIPTSFRGLPCFTAYPLDTE